MNLLQVHNFYREKGGEDVVADEEYRLLKNSHNVQRYQVDNTSDLQSLFSRLKLIVNTHYSGSAARRMKELIRTEGIDLMHVHNFFPLLSPSIFDAARDVGIPSVLTLHNYRLIHPNGQLFHNGSIDRRSIGGSAWRCVPDGVYRDSVLQTAVVAHMIEYHRKRGTWARVPTLFIALTEFARQTFIEGGLPGNRIVVKPNFMEDPFKDGGDQALADSGLNHPAGSPPQTAGGKTDPAGVPPVDGAGSEGNPTDDYFLYAGRISPEKGIRQLIDYWRTGGVASELRIIGEGPDTESLRQASKGLDNVKWLGGQPRDVVLKQMKEARALLFPSLWYEGFPMILVEALAVGCPVITSNIGSQAEIIEEGRTGLHFDPADPASLARAVGTLSGNSNRRDEMSHQARSAYLDNYTPEINLKLLTEIYRKARELEVRYQASAKFRS